MIDSANDFLQKRNTVFETKIKPMLNYIGTIGAIITSIAYIILVFVLIFGFKAQSITQTVIFSIANGLAGLIIMQFLKIQGISFAKNIKENADILERYYSTKTKDKKNRHIKYYWLTSLPKDIFFKALSIILFTGSVIYIVIAGSNNYALMALSIVNLLMFFSFGMLSLSSAYDFFNQSHIPYIIDRLNEIENKISDKGDSENDNL